MLQSSNISPLKEEILGLKSQLASVTAERNLLQEALRKIQSRVSLDVESSLSRQAQNYESRLTELHSVIAELRKQLEVQREKIIPEESTEDENDGELDGDPEGSVEYPGLPTPEPDVESAASSPTTSSSLPSNSTTDPGDKHDGAITSRKTDDDDTPGENEARECQYRDDNDKEGEETNRRISVSRSRRRNLQNYHQPNGNRNIKSTSEESDRTDIKDKALHTDLNLRDLEMKSWKEENPRPSKVLQALGNPERSVQTGEDSQTRESSEMIPEKPRLSPDGVLHFAALRDEVALIREEHYAIRETLFRKEGELDRTRNALENIAEERDFLKKKVVELEYLLKQSPKKFPQFMPNAPDLTPMPTSGEESGFMCKVAERVKLNQSSSPRSPSHNLNHSRNHQNNNNNNNNNHHNNNNNNNNCHHHHHHHQSIHLNMNSVMQIQQQPTQQQSLEDHPTKHNKNGKNHSSGKPNSSLISGQELAAIGNSCSTRIVEHLVQPLQDESTITEMQQAFANSNQPGSMAEDKIREFEIETERLNSRLEHLRSQNDVLNLNLDDAKSHADHLTVLLGKYESNNIGHQIALSFSDQLIEAYDVLVALLESELGLLLANCRAAGIGATSGTTSSTGNGSQGMEDDIDVATLLQRANENRMTAEIAARNLIIRMVDSPGSENNNGMMLHLPVPHQSNLPPWEDASSCSQTLSSASSVGESSNHSHGGSRASGESRSGSIEKNEEQRVRDYIIQLKTDRESVRGTLMELENWSMEPPSPMQPNLSPCDILEARKLDLETAVLMQELMAMREDRAELRAQLFLLEKEKANLEYRLEGYEVQQDAYKARLNHLKAELADAQQENATPRQITPETQNLNQNVAETEGNVNNNNAHNLTQEREMILKKRLQELALSLEKITQNASLREKQSNETVNELKKANNILLDTLETVKRKYQSRVKKMEEQIVSVMERHSLQMKLYKDRLHHVESEMMERSHHQSQHR